MCKEAGCGKQPKDLKNTEQVSFKSLKKVLTSAPSLSPLFTGNLNSSLAVLWFISFQSTLFVVELAIKINR